MRASEIISELRVNKTSFSTLLADESILMGFECEIVLNGVRPSRDHSAMERCAHILETELGIEKIFTSSVVLNDKDNYHWYIEPDSSIKTGDPKLEGAEIVSSVYPLGEGLDTLSQFFSVMSKRGWSTNESTGLHINISIDGKNGSDFDFLKMIVLFDENYTAELFGRLGNTYANQMREAIFKRMSLKLGIPKDQLTVRTILNSNDLSEVISALKKVGAGLEDSFSKYQSIRSRKNGVFEFRGMGGSNYETRYGDIRKRVVNMANILKVGSDDSLLVKEYVKRVFILLDQGKFQSKELGSGKLQIPPELDSFSTLFIADKKLLNSPLPFYVSMALKLCYANYNLSPKQTKQLINYVKKLKVSRSEVRDTIGDDSAYNALAKVFEWPLLKLVSDDGDDQISDIKF